MAIRWVLCWVLVNGIILLTCQICWTVSVYQQAKVYAIRLTKLVPTKLIRGKPIRKHMRGRGIKAVIPPKKNASKTLKIHKTWPLKIQWTDLQRTKCGWKIDQPSQGVQALHNPFWKTYCTLHGIRPTRFRSHFTQKVFFRHSLIVVWPPLRGSAFGKSGAAILYYDTRTRKFILFLWCAC